MKIEYAIFFGIGTLIIIVCQILHNQSDIEFKHKLQLSEDSIALYKKHEEQLLLQISKSEDKVKGLEQGVSKILDSLKTISHEKQILWTKLNSIKPQYYTPNELNRIWAERYKE